MLEPVVPVAPVAPIALVDPDGAPDAPAAEPAAPVAPALVPLAVLPDVLPASLAPEEEPLVLASKLPASLLVEAEAVEPVLSEEQPRRAAAKTRPAATAKEVIVFMRHRRARPTGLGERHLGPFRAKLSAFLASPTRRPHETNGRDARRGADSAKRNPT